MNIASHIEKQKKVSLNMSNVKLLFNGEEICSFTPINASISIPERASSAHSHRGTIRGIRANSMWIEDYEPSE